ncbi:MAG: hypothetical protein Tsb0013_10900 [Phycisphaerales bacterium]
MSVAYRAVQWNAHKKVYDLVLAGGVLLFLVAFVGVSMAVSPPPGEIAVPVLVMRALGVCAIVLLHVILAIGPLHRLDARFAPLLYNRRHLGVTMFLLALLHALIAIGFYGGFGVQNPLVAVLAGYASQTLTGLPFEVFGFAALVILFLMASTSHDFWTKHLTPAWWKLLHTLVYVAYVLLIAHVVFGALQSEASLVFPALLGVGTLVLGGLHIAAGVRETTRLRPSPVVDGWVEVGPARDIPEGRARVIALPDGERVAVYRVGERVHALTNVCPHQGGPLGEGAIVDGCVTCPWHGYQFSPEDGTSPPPYDEKIPTYDLRTENGVVYVKAQANEPGTPTQGVTIERTVSKGGDA